MKQRLHNGKMTLEQETKQRDIDLTPQVPEELGQVRLPNENEKELAKDISKNITERQNEINELLKDLPQEKQDVILGELAKEYGVSLEQLQAQVKVFADQPTLPPSQIFANLGWLPISEMLQRVELDFQFGNLIPTKLVRNGLHRILYRDFWKIDHRTAYKQEDYTFDPIHNPKGGIVSEEIWPVNNNIHMGFTMWDASLNQNTRDVALFLAMFNEYEWNIVKPISVEFYRIQLRMIATGIDYEKYPLDDESGDPKGVDWSTLTQDVEIKGNNDYDALIKLFSWMIGLDQPSRRNLPTRWNPKGMMQNLMTQFKMSNYVLLAPVEFVQYLNVMLKSGRFHEKYLKMLPEVMAIDFDKSFGEFNGDTNFKTSYADAHLRLIPKASEKKGAWITSQYEGTRSMPNLNLTSVIHYWTLVGVAFHRETPILNIHFTSAGGDGSGGRTN